MLTHLTVLHLGALICAVGAIWGTWREAHGWPRRWPSLMGAAILVMLASANLLLVQFLMEEGVLHKRWVAGVVGGLAVGAWRGSRTGIQVDHLWGLMRLPRDRDGLWMSLLCVAIVVFEIASVFVDTLTQRQHVYVVAIAAGCGGFMMGRLFAILVRARLSPQEDLR